MIKKIAGKYVVVGLNRRKRSPAGRNGRLGEKTKTKSGKLRRFGTYKTLAEAKKRLAQVEFFKHRGKR